MSANLTNSAVAIGLESSVFVPIPNKGSAKECSNYCTAILTSYASKIMFKILLARLQQYTNRGLSDVQTGFRKGRRIRDQLPTFVESRRKQGSSRITSTSASLTTGKFLTVWITTNWKILKKVGVAGHITYLLRTIYVGQEAAVRILRETTVGSKLGKEYIKTV